MKLLATSLLLSVSLIAGEAKKAQEVEDWAQRHAMPEGLRSLVERSAADGIAICKRTLRGKSHAAVRSFLGVSDLNHGEEEYTYHPVRKDGSMWILLVEFDSDQVVDVLGYELQPPQKKRKPIQPPQTTTGSSAPSRV
jgi:hypothetical protein